jgi:hypothetical protein
VSDRELLTERNRTKRRETTMQKSLKNKVVGCGYIDDPAGRSNHWIVDLTGQGDTIRVGRWNYFDSALYGEVEVWNACLADKAFRYCEEKNATAAK